LANASKQDNSRGSSGLYFGALDGFRGLLAVFVAIYHTYWYSHINRSPFFENGPVIIDLFFVFSGFLLFTIYGQKIRSVSDGAKFIKKRFARLYPLHLFTFCLFMLFASSRVVTHGLGIASLDHGEILPFQPGARESIFTVFSNLTLTQAMGFHDHTSFNVPSWTISVEFFAYFSFIAWLILVPPRKVWHFGAMGLGIAGLYALLSRLKPDMDITYDYAFLRCLAGFYTGVVVAAIYKPLKSSRFVQNIGFGLASLIEIAVIILSSLFVIYCTGKLQFFVAPVLFAFVLVFAFDKGIVSKFMMQKPFRYFAKISYSVYMVHMIIAVLFYTFSRLILERMWGPDWYEAGWAGDIFLIPYMMVVLVFSHFTQKYIEVRGGKFIMSQKFGITDWIKKKAPSKP